MSPFELDPLDPEIDDLLSDDRAACGHELAPVAAKARVIRRVELGLAGLGVAGLPTVTGTGVLPRAPVGLWPLGKRIAVGIASLAVGGGAGAGAMHWHDAHVAVTGRGVDAPVVTPSLTGHPEPVLSATLAPPAAPATVAVAVRAAPSPSAPPSTLPSASVSERTASEDLAAERILLDEARASLLQGESGKAVAPLLEHARRHPRGRLVEEREALLVQALARSGRAAEARESGARFQQRFPGSLFGAAVQDALSSISDK